MAGWRIALIALALCLTAAPSLCAQSAPAVQFPLALECTLVAIQHAKTIPGTETTADDQRPSNRCIQAVQVYARTHCPQSGATIWAQIEAVADTSSSDDDMALRAACR
jgi:hypothetical protein